MAGSGRSVQALNAVDVHRGRGGDALVDKEILAAPDAGIVIDLGRQQADDGANALATLKGLRG